MLSRLRRSMRDNRGFGMIEIMGAIVILSILASAAVPFFVENRKRATQQTMLDETLTLMGQLDYHFDRFSQYPTTISDSGSVSATHLRFKASKGTGFNISGQSTDGYTLRTRNIRAKDRECTVVVTGEDNALPECEKLDTEWTGTDPSA